MSRPSCGVKRARPKMGDTHLFRLAFFLFLFLFLLIYIPLVESVCGFSVCGKLLNGTDT